MPGLLTLGAIGACGPGYLVVDDGPEPTIITGTASGALVDGWADCAWITDSHGRRFDVGYPAGWTWSVDPFRAEPPTGRTVVRAGDLATVRGAFPEVAESACRSGEIFDVVEVLSVQPQSPPSSDIPAP